MGWSSSSSDASSPAASSKRRVRTSQPAGRPAPRRHQDIDCRLVRRPTNQYIGTGLAVEQIAARPAEQQIAAGAAV
jgi:hypothetical protein